MKMPSLEKDIAVETEEIVIIEYHITQKLCYIGDIHRCRGVKSI